MTQVTKAGSKGTKEMVINQLVEKADGTVSDAREMMGQLQANDLWVQSQVEELNKRFGHGMASQKEHSDHKIYRHYRW